MGNEGARHRLGDLTLDARLGVGAVGEVHRAFTPDGTRVAVKVARQEVVADPRVLRLLEAEIRAMARLDHPHVLWLLDRGLVPEDHPSPCRQGCRTSCSNTAGAGRSGPSRSPPGTS
ncbi:MAG: hypothetical protein KC621_24100 [Myxococcales bacterium]|nr:hypothetical protein [Myxococcales bacterium]